MWFSDQLDDHPQPASVRLVEKGPELLQRPVTRVDVRVVRDVVPVVLERRWIHGLYPEAVDPERFEIVELRREPDEVADAVGIAVRERLHVKLVEDGVLVPQRICGFENGHRKPARGTSDSRAGRAHTQCTPPSIGRSPSLVVGWPTASRRGSAMPSDDRRPVAGAVFSKREAILLAAAAMTVVATLTVLLSTR